MAISYPLSLPSNPGPTRITLGSTVAVSLIRSPFTFQSQVQQYAGAMWTAEVTLPLMERTQAEEWISFLLMCWGQSGTFLLGDTAAKTPRGSVLGNPTINGTQYPGAKIMSVTTFTPSITNILRAGDYIQVQNRLYKVLQDVNSDVTGQATFDIFPPIREGLLNGDTVVTYNTKGLFRLSSSTTPIFNVDDAKHYEISFSAVEAV